MTEHEFLIAMAERLDGLPDRARKAVQSCQTQEERDRCALALLDQFVHVIADTLRVHAAHHHPKSNAA